MKTLHLGCGRKKHQDFGGEVVTLDADARLEPDVVCTLGVERMPFADDEFDQAVAVHVLEHIGRQGETAGWFLFWEELYRVLKPGGTLTFESPLYTSVWAWADPSHARALSPQAFVFMSQDSYRFKDSAISPFRIACDFLPIQPFEGIQDGNPDVAAFEPASHFRGILQAIKPLKPWWTD